MSETGTNASAADQNPPTDAPQVSTVEHGSGYSQASTNPVQVSTPVPTNVFTVTLQVTLDFTTAQIKALVKEEYFKQDAVLYWKFRDIKEWFQLKSKIPVRRSGTFSRDGTIKCLQELAWWVIDLILWGKDINLNNFISDVLSDAIEESLLFPEFCQYHVSKNTTARPQLPSIISHKTSSRSCNTNRYNTHYLSQLFCTITHALQYS